MLSLGVRHRPRYTTMDDYRELGGPGNLRKGDRAVRASHLLTSGAGSTGVPSLWAESTEGNWVREVPAGSFFPFTEVY